MSAIIVQIAVHSTKSVDMTSRDISGRKLDAVDYGLDY